MLSKEEIEEAKQRILKSLNDVIFCTLYSQEENDKDEKILLEYIDYLERKNKTLIHTNKTYKGIINKQNKDEQKLIEKLEEDKQQNYYNGKYEGNFRKSVWKDEYAKEILSILKGENDE